MNSFIGSGFFDSGAPWDYSGKELVGTDGPSYKGSTDPCRGPMGRWLIGPRHGSDKHFRPRFILRQ